MSFAFKQPNKIFYKLYLNSFFTTSDKNFFQSSSSSQAVCTKMITQNAFILRIKNKFTLIVRNTTVEPLLPLYIIASVLTAYGAQNLYLDKACRVNLNYTSDVCDALMRRDTKNLQHEDTEVQKLVAEMNSWKTVVQTFIPCLLILFVGSWSDRNGRRKWDKFFFLWKFENFCWNLIKF